MVRVDYDVIGICGTNTYYLFDDLSRETIIIDPAGDFIKIHDRVTRQGLKPIAVLLTHGHFDHILAVEEVRKKYNIPVYIGINEKEVIQNPDINLSNSFTASPVTTTADIYLEDNQIFDIGSYHIKAIELPGHTVGGMCYYLEAENIVFTGDTLFCGSVGRSDFPGGNGRSLLLGIKKRLFTLPKNTVVYPGHMDETTIEQEKENNPFCS